MDESTLKQKIDVLQGSIGELRVIIEELKETQEELIDNISEAVGFDVRYSAGYEDDES